MLPGGRPCFHQSARCWACAVANGAAGVRLIGAQGDDCLLGSAGSAGHGAPHGGRSASRGVALSLGRLMAAGDWRPVFTLGDRLGFLGRKPRRPKRGEAAAAAIPRPAPRFGGRRWDRGLGSIATAILSPTIHARARQWPACRPAEREGPDKSDTMGGGGRPLFARPASRDAPAAGGFVSSNHAAPRGR